MAPTKREVIERTRKWFAKIERPFSSISLIGGFVFDALTLTRVDQLWDNIWVVVHLAIVTTCALIINLIDNSGSDETDPAKLHFWLVNVMQFFFGGIFSTFLVFYFRSGTLGNDWPFLLLLAAAFVANERLKRHYARLAFQIALLFLSYYAFAIYLMPILFHEISTSVFIVSGLVSLAAIAGFIGLLRKFSHERFVGRAKWITRGAVLLIFASVNALYFANLIPPLPLSLKDSGIYHSLVVNAPGSYTAQSEPSGNWLSSFFNPNETVHIQPSAPLYAYTAVFSPTSLNTQIVHEWQYYNATTSAWVTRERVTLSVTGGADGGYRTFSLLPNLSTGPWRVNVETPRGQIIGQMNFTVVVTSTPIKLQTTQI